MARRLVNGKVIQNLCGKVLPFFGSAGVISDIASPLAPFSDYLTSIAAIGVFALSIYWFFYFNKDEAWGLDFGFMPRALIYCGVATVIFGAFSVSQAVTNSENKGVIASMVPGIEKIQRSIFRLEKATKEISQKLDRIEADMEKKYSLEELKILADQEMWDEALGHLEDIPPLERDQAWRSVLEQVIVGWLYDMEISEDVELAHQNVSKIFQRFKVLKKSPEAMEYRKRIGMRYMEKCLRADPVKDCYSAAMAFVRYDRKSVSDLAFEVGKLTTYHRLPRGAVPYFDLAVSEQKGHRYCAEDRLQLAIKNGLQGFSNSKNMQQSRRLARYCFDYIKAELASDLNRIRTVSSSTEYLCGLFEEMGDPLAHCEKFREKKGSNLKGSR